MIYLYTLFHNRKVNSLLVGKSALRFPEQHADFTPVEENKVGALVCDVRADLSSDDAVPRWVVHRVKLRFDDFGNIV